MVTNNTRIRDYKFRFMTDSRRENYNDYLPVAGKLRALKFTVRFPSDIQYSKDYYEDSDNAITALEILTRRAFNAPETLPFANLPSLITDKSSESAQTTKDQLTSLAKLAKALPFLQKELRKYRHLKSGGTMLRSRDDFRKGIHKSRERDRVLRDAGKKLGLPSPEEYKADTDFKLVRLCADHALMQWAKERHQHEYNYLTKTQAYYKRKDSQDKAKRELEKAILNGTEDSLSFRYAEKEGNSFEESFLMAPKAHKYNHNDQDETEKELSKSIVSPSEVGDSTFVNITRELLSDTIEDVKDFTNL
jgi:hypothetical protein